MEGTPLPAYSDARFGAGFGRASAGSAGAPDAAYERPAFLKA